MNNLLRKIPPIHLLQNHERFKGLIDTYKLGEREATSLLQQVVNDLRTLIVNGNDWDKECSLMEWIFGELENKIKNVIASSLKRVINGTGTVLHTNLGRAKLSKEAIQSAIEVGANYSNLEFDLISGARGSRHDHVEKILTEITGAEAAMVVNNNAASVYLILRALAKDKEVIVSRGELVEIGGSFRVSSIMEESGANLVEVGTTNRTHVKDYQVATNENTRMYMKVHTSNFSIQGFTKSVSAKELVQLNEQNSNVIVYEDLGSGVLFDFSQLGIGNEPLIQTVVQTGVDIISFSGDKLLGGPQAGIILGKKELIQKLKTHQLARVLRVDKMTLAALEATLFSYKKGIDWVMSIPTIQMVTEDKEQIFERIQRFLQLINKNEMSIEFRVEGDVSQIGGGTMSDVRIPTYVLKWKHQVKKSVDCQAELLAMEIPVIGRIQQDEILFDFRTIQEEELEILAAALQSL